MKKQISLRGVHFVSAFFCALLSSLFFFVLQKATGVYFPSAIWPFSDLANVALALAFTLLFSSLQFHFSKKDCFGLSFAWFSVSFGLNLGAIIIIMLSSEPRYALWLGGAAGSLAANFLPIAILSSFIYYAVLSLMLKER
jgi:hypothetical protein